MPELLLIALGVLFIAGFTVLFIRSGRAGSQESQIVADELRRRAEVLSQEKSALEERARMLSGQAERLLTEAEQKDQTILSLNNRLTARETEYRNLEQKLQEQRAELDLIQEKFRTEFKNLANDIFDEKTRRFSDLNASRLDEILKPLGEKILTFEKKVQDVYEKESNQRFSLEKEIRNLANLNQQISKEASNLTNALKGQTKTQGNWGEMILETILEKSGLTQDREFFVQPSFTGESGRRLQPDVVVTYPGERNVVIDSKVSLVAYERYASAETREEQEVAAREHLVSVKNHIAELSGKSYQDIYSLKSLDFVMLFVPVEPAYLLAMQHDPGLWNWAYDRRVLLISPTNLIAALRMIANLWRVEYQNKNALEIARQGGELYDKFVGFLEDLQDIGGKLDATKKAYDASINKLAEGKGNLIRRVENIRALGAKTGKEIPRGLAERSEE